MFTTMIVYRLNIVLLFIPVVIGINTKEPLVNSSIVNSSVIVTPKTLLAKEGSNRKSETGLIEGGPIVPQGSITQEDTILDSSSKSIKGRKGVKFNSEDSTENKPANGTDNTNDLLENSLAPSTKPVLLDKVMSKTDDGEQVKPIKHKLPPKKPLKLSYDAVSSSAADKTLPVAKSVVPVKQASSPSSHPGMIMPVVITLLVVPMFAVLGYLALRRGQEAWKNRHYKRMDFLLDGMYND